jgi:segregation and condensation protein A
MAKKGEVDPWNVDVIEVADRFLKKLEKAQKLDLRISGRVLLYAAIFVRIKADILTEEVLGVSKQEVVPDEIDFHSFFDQDTFNLEPPVDETIKTLLSPRKKIRRFTTLNDLIFELQMAEMVEQRRRQRKKEKGEVARKALETPHEESIEETIAIVEKELRRFFNRRSLIYFSEVVRGKNTVEKISYYLSILHLAFRRRLEMYQKRIYEEDIELRPC